MAITASRAEKITPNLCHTSRRSMVAKVRAGSRRRVSGLRGVPSATASTRSAWPVRGGRSRGSAGSSVTVARPRDRDHPDLVALRLKLLTELGVPAGETN